MALRGSGALLIAGEGLWLSTPFGAPQLPSHCQIQPMALLLHHQYKPSLQRQSPGENGGLSAKISMFEPCPRVSGQMGCYECCPPSIAVL